MVDPFSQLPHSDTEILAVPQELAPLIRDIIQIYENGSKQAVIDTLNQLPNLIKLIKKNGYGDEQSIASLWNPTADRDLGTIADEESEEDFLKSWDDIFNMQVYIDTEIFGELDPRPPALTELESKQSIGDTVIEHTEATEIYVQSWKELAQSISAFPDDLFTRLWTTVEIAKILECSPNSLRRSRRAGRLPIQIKNLILDCISHDGRRSLWFVRPV